MPEGMTGEILLMLLVTVGALIRTGVVDSLAKVMARVAGKSELRLIGVTLLIAVPVSAFLNNTPVVIVLMPVILGIARDAGHAPSRVLMPLSFGSQMGGTLTLIGTSTNLLVAGLILDLGMDRIRLFDITPPALVLLAVGGLYLLTVGRWITPVREGAQEPLSFKELRQYLTGLAVEEGSPLSGRSLLELRFAEEYGLEVVAIQREDQPVIFPTGKTVIQGSDLLLVQGSAQAIARVEVTGHLTIAAPAPELEGPAGHLEQEEWMAVPMDADLPEEQLHLAEIIVPPGSCFIGRTLRSIGFRDRYHLAVLAIQRHGEVQHEPVGAQELEAGDILLVRGSHRALQELHRRGEFTLLGGAMQNTGTASFLAENMLAFTAPLGLLGMLAAFYLLTSLLTEVISNNAAAVVLTPIAVAAGMGMEVSPLPFVVAVMFSASNAFMTPIGYQTNTFIYGPGGYRFLDYLRVGGPLNLLLVVVATFVIPIFFPF